MSDAERLQKRLATLGLGSRREIERWIEAGRVTVNGEVATLGMRVTNKDQVVVDGKRIELADKEPSKHVLIYNKPEGQICTRKDTEGRETVFDSLPAVHNGRWISIGRLDINTSGLIVFTTDGELANRLMHPSYQIDREYAVRVLGDVSDDMLNQLITGVQLEDGPARFEEIVAPKPDEDNPKANQWYYVCLQEGRNREVRRIWETLPNIKVSRLKRVRYANIFLEKTLSLGQWRLATQEEMDDLYQLVELTAPVLKEERQEEGERKQKHQRARVSPRVSKTKTNAQQKQREQQRRQRRALNKSRGS